MVGFRLELSCSVVGVRSFALRDFVLRRRGLYLPVLTEGDQLAAGGDQEGVLGDQQVAARGAAFGEMDRLTRLQAGCLAEDVDRIVRRPIDLVAGKHASTVATGLRVLRFGPDA